MPLVARIAAVRRDEYRPAKHAFQQSSSFRSSDSSAAAARADVSSRTKNKLHIQLGPYNFFMELTDPVPNPAGPKTDDTRRAV
jgi:hypothetical protein